MKKRNKDSQNGKALAVASALGIAAVVVSVFAAYNTAMKRLVPTDTSSESSWVYSNSSSDVPVQNNVTGIPIESSKPSSTTKPASSEPAEEVNKPIVAVDIGNVLPVTGEVSNPFSNGELVKSETLGVWKTHDGCDILCDLGTDVKSMSEGTVKEIKDDPLWGVYVIVEQSNGLEVHYCGLAKELNIKAGQQVNQGEIIGKTGETNQCEVLQQPHLHLGVKRGGDWVDPMSVINAAS
ncbi:MAG: M23 family metallopeptidase [Ruminococcaceae bacterium]|nr:M23 family metallopeptidase [Oscillospiraceae bacterium]